MLQYEHGSETSRPLGNYDRPTIQPTGGQEGSKGSYYYKNKITKYETIGFENKTLDKGSNHKEKDETK